MIQVCPLCADADDVVKSPLGPGVWHFVCRRVKNHPGIMAYEWDATDEDVLGEDEHTGLAGELDLPSDLLKCLVPGDPWVEYGVIEHRYSLLNPDSYQILLDTFGHTRISKKRYTASVYIALTLGRMSKTEEVCWSSGPGTGYWHYNSSISYWALPPAPAADRRLTYEVFAVREGLNPNV